MRTLRYIVFALLGLSLFLGSCKKEGLITDAGAKIVFSNDTLRFDTVFTKVGSATRFIKILNPHNQSIQLSKVYLEKGSSSLFNLNIDGVSGDLQENIVIPAKDSIYVFAEVTIDPNRTENPFVIDEKLIVEVNGNQQSMVLEAWGQNANYIPNNLVKGKIATMTQDQFWNDPKPYVIYGILVVDGCKLTIAAGTRIHVHGGLVKTNQRDVYSDGMIYVQNGGEIEINGTKDKIVLIEGDRLEKEFEQIPSQWNLIYFGPESKASFSYATIKNSRIGLFADSLSTVRMKYCQIFNTGGPGIFARQADVQLDNCLIHSNGDRSVVIAQGGEFRSTYSTIANFGANSPAIELSNAYCKTYDSQGNCIQLLTSPLRSIMRNSIINSSQRDALSFFEVQNAGFNYSFENCIYRVEDLVKAERGGYVDFFTHSSNCINLKSTDKLFKKIDADNYRLDTLSIAENKALPVIGFEIDLDGVNRDVSKPDIGAYEFKPR
ncbi:MAG: right-handed parallel beta-helix repeat-containing protein [Saprospiraceae bacterium]